MTNDNGNTRPGTFDADTPAPADTRAQRGRWTVLTAVSLGLLLATIDTSILYIAVPVLEDALGRAPASPCGSSTCTHWS